MNDKTFATDNIIVLAALTLIDLFTTDCTLAWSRPFITGQAFVGRFLAGVFLAEVTSFPVPLVTLFLIFKCQDIDGLVSGSP